MGVTDFNGNFGMMIRGLPWSSVAIVGPLKTTWDVSTWIRRKTGASAPSSEGFSGVERHIWTIMFDLLPGVKPSIARRSDAYPVSTQRVHGWADEATLISAMSNVAAEIYEPMLAGTRHTTKYFRIVPATSPLTPHAVTLHALLPSHTFLVMLTYPIRIQGASIALVVGDSHYLEALTGREKDLRSAIKVIVGRKRNIEEVLDDEDD